MIDTVILSLPIESVRLLDRAIWKLQAKGKSYDKYVLNASPEQKASGLYFPTLTAYRRKNGIREGLIDIKVKFSPSKLLYRNNADELIENQFEEVVRILAERMADMQVVVPLNALRTAPASRVDYGRNIKLENGFTARYAIAELGKINLSQRLQMTRARYINDGRSLCFYATSFSIIFYDKIADLIKGKRVAIDKYQLPYQQSLFKHLQRAEVMRYEVRLCTRKKINSLFKKLGFAPNPTFRDVFSLEKSQKVLQYYWDTMVAKDRVALFVPSFSKTDLLNQVLIARPTIKGKAAMHLAALLLFARDDDGMRKLRATLGKRINDRTWYEFVAEMRSISADLDNIRPREWIEQVEKALKSYQPLRLGAVNKSKV